MPYTTARVTVAMCSISCCFAIRVGSGISARTRVTMRSPSRRKKNSTNSISRNPTNVPSAPRNTLPPSPGKALQQFRRVFDRHVCMSATLTPKFVCNHSKKRATQGNCAQIVQ